MRALDTDLLVRIITRDDPRQTIVIDRLLDRADVAGEVFFVPVTVLLELEWVLRSVYKRTRSQIVSALRSLLKNEGLDIAHHGAVEWAVERLEAGPGRIDLADALHVGVVADVDHGPLLTFDTGCASIPGAELLR